MDILKYAETTAWITGVVAGAFAATHAVVRDDFNKEQGERLLGFDLQQWFTLWVDQLVKYFNVIYGKKQISKRCFVSSAKS